MRENRGLSFTPWYTNSLTSGSNIYPSSPADRCLTMAQHQPRWLSNASTTTAFLGACALASPTHSVEDCCLGPLLVHQPSLSPQTCLHNIHSELHNSSIHDGAYSYGKVTKYMVDASESTCTHLLFNLFFYPSPLFNLSPLCPAYFERMTNNCFLCTFYDHNYVFMVGGAHWVVLQSYTCFCAQGLFLTELE